MHELKWNQFEIVECIGTVPVFGELLDAFTFENVLDDLCVRLSVWPWENIVAIEMARDSKVDPFFSLFFVVRDQIAFIKEEKLMSLRFLDCVIISSRFWQYERDEREKYFDFETTMKTDFELSTFPRLALKVL